MSWLLLLIQAQYLFNLVQLLTAVPYNYQERNANSLLCARMHKERLPWWKWKQNIVLWISDRWPSVEEEMATRYKKRWREVLQSDWGYKSMLLQCQLSLEAFSKFKRGVKTVGPFMWEIISRGLLWPLLTEDANTPYKWYKIYVLGLFNPRPSSSRGLSWPRSFGLGLSKPWLNLDLKVFV